MKPIRLLHTSDLHVGVENYGSIDPDTGINHRVMDFIRRFDDTVQYAIDQDIDLFVFAGDAYKTSDPSPTYQREFARRVKRLADAGIPAILLVGNHDLPAVARRASSVSIFDTLEVPNVHVGDREELIEIRCRHGQQLQIGLAPYPLRASLLTKEEQRGKSLQELDELLENALMLHLRLLASRAAEKPDVPAILVGHFSVHTAERSSEEHMGIGRDAGVPRSALTDPAWRYVALGHIHKHQSLNNEAMPPVIYSGSLERIDFGEEKDNKGFVVAEIGDQDTRWEFIQEYRRRARPFLTIPVDVRGASDATAALLAAIERAGDLSETVVRLIVNLREEQEPSLSQREIAKALEGANYVAAIQKIVDRPSRERLGGISVEAMTPKELLAAYLRVKGLPAERAEILQASGSELIDQVDRRETAAGHES